MYVVFATSHGDEGLGLLILPSNTKRAHTPALQARSALCLQDLLMVGVDQANRDGNRWELAYRMMLLEEPPTLELQK